MEIISVICSRRTPEKATVKWEFWISHKMAFRPREEMAGENEPWQPCRMWPWLSFPWAPTPPGLSRPSWTCSRFSRLVFVALFGRTLNHNACIIYFRLRLKVFKLLFNLVFPSWVTRTKRRWMATKTSQINMQICSFLFSRVLFIENG